MSDETKTKISESMSGTNNPMFGIKKFGKANPFYGKTHNKDTRDKIRKTKKNLMPIDMRTEDDQIIHFDSLNLAVKHSGLHKNTIKNCVFPVNLKMV
jgi:hypothetical protein